jgi:hypothetical protein
MDKKNVQNRKTFFQFSAIKYRSPELCGSLNNQNPEHNIDTIFKDEKKVYLYMSITIDSDDPIVLENLTDK